MNTEEQIEQLKTQAAKDRKMFENRIYELERILKNHGHEGDDGSTRIVRSIHLLPGQSFGIGEVRIYSGSGTPEAVVTAPIGSIYLRTDGSTSTTLYVKTSGTSSTGWTAK